MRRLPPCIEKVFACMTCSKSVRMMLNTSRLSIQTSLSCMSGQLNTTIQIGEENKARGRVGEITTVDDHSQ